MIMKTLTAGVLAITLTLTSLSPNQAQAEISEGDAMIGIVTLLLLGAAINSHNDNDAPTPVTHTNRGNWRILPAVCQNRFRNQDGNITRLYSRRCMANNYSNVNRLPQNCFRQVRDEFGQRHQGYRLACMRRQGFRTN